MKKQQTERRRSFTDEYKLGDKVAVIRTEHGWHDGSLIGRISWIVSDACAVTDDDGFVHQINHPRDIQKVVR